MTDHLFQPPVGWAGGCDHVARCGLPRTEHQRALLDQPPGTVAGLRPGDTVRVVDGRIIRSLPDQTGPAAVLDAVRAAFASQQEDNWGAESIIDSVAEKLGVVSDPATPTPAHPDDPPHIRRADLIAALDSLAITDPDRIAAIHIHPKYALVVRRDNPTTVTTRRIEIR